AVACGDYDGDGAVDYAVSNYSSGTVSVLRNTGTGTFQPAVNYAAGGYASAVAAADLDGDGHPDLDVSNFATSGTGTVSVLYNDGDWGAGPQGPAPRLAGLPPFPELTEAPSRADVLTTTARPRPLVEAEDFWAAGGADKQPARARPMSAVRADDAWINLFGIGDRWLVWAFPEPLEE